MMRLILILLVVSVGVSQNLRIPDRLIHCYRGNFTEFWFPQSMPLVIEIIRKIEASHPTSVDLRHISARLFHDLRIDGIQRSPLQETEEITPYGRSGSMTHKNIVLQQLISNVAGSFNYNQILTPYELCTLHKLLSSSVEPYERHDELRNCPRSILNATVGQRPTNIAPRPKNPSVHHRQPFSNFTVVAPNFSRCPVETGVAFDQSGLGVHPGVIIANIASGLQPQQVRIGEFLSEYRVRDPFVNLETMEATDSKKKIAKLLSSLDSIDNTYASGLAGDMAEVVLYQGPLATFTIGFPGMWNDTDLPRMFHFIGNQQTNWHLTDTEILSGIDGIFVSQQVSTWTSRIRRLRLSQVLEMFYLHQGISIPTIESNMRRRFFKGNSVPKNPDQGTFNDIIPASFDSKKIFKKSFQYSKFDEEMLEVVIKYLSRFSVAQDIAAVCHRKKIVEMIDVDKLKEQTLAFVQILEEVTHSQVMSHALMQQYTNEVVDRTMDYARKLVENTPPCKSYSVDYSRTAIDLTLIIDGSRNAYENLQMINQIAEMIDVSAFSSFISIIHGSTGRFLVNRTNSLPNLFEQLRNSSDIGNPIRLSLSNSFRTLMFQLVEQTTQEKANSVFGALPKVCLVVSQSQRVGEMDFESAQNQLLGSLKQFPDLYFVFLSNDINTFKDMALQTNPDMEPSERYHFVAVDSIRVSTFKQALDTTLRSFPKRISSPFCKVTDEKRLWSDVLKRDDFEAYLSPNEETRYRISPFYLMGSDEVRVKFQGVGYGDFSVCLSRERDMLSRECKSVTDMEFTWFNISQPCSNHNAYEPCLGIYFALQIETTFSKCSESDCRFHDDVRISVRPEGLRCERNGLTRFTAKFSLVMLSALIVISDVWN